MDIKYSKISKNFQEYLKFHRLNLLKPYRLSPITIETLTPQELKL